MIETIAIGTFDGMHIAHQKLIDLSDGVVVVSKGYESLTRGWKRSLYTNKPIFVYQLKDIKHLSAREFIDKLYMDFPNLKKIVVGYDFVFGKDRSADSKALQKYFKGSVEVIDEIKLNGKSVHSRVVRESVGNGDVELASKLLGRPYRIDGEQVRGQGLGSKELVPTINLNIKGYILPPGIFLVNVEIKRVKYKAIAFVGHRLTVDGEFSFEIHILGKKLKHSIDGKIWVEFIKFIRDVKKFDTIAKLKEQIKIDLKEANNMIISSSFTKTIHS